MLGYTGRWGFAVFYITITLAFREYELLPQPLAFGLLILTTVACVVLSLFYDRKELALFALSGGFIAPFMVSTGNGNYIILFCYILLLNSGMLWLVFRKNWDIIGQVAFGCTQLIVWGWLLHSFTDEFVGGFVFLLLFFIQFHTLALAGHVVRNTKMTVAQTIFILCNNLSLFGGCLYVFRHYPVDLNGLLTILPALLNAVALVLVFRNRRTDPSLLYLLIACILTFITLAVPIQLKGNVITLFWSAEVVILLFLWLRSKKALFRVAMYSVLGLVVVSYLMDITGDYAFYFWYSDPALPVILNKYFITGVGLLAAFCVGYYLLKRQPCEQADCKRVLRIFSAGIFSMAFILPFNEINYQLCMRLPEDTGVAFEYIALWNFTAVYAGSILFLKRKAFRKNYQTYFVLLFAFVTIYTLFYLWGILPTTRYDIYLLHYLPTSWFWIHLISLPAIAYLFYVMGRICLKKKETVYNRYLLGLVILAVIIGTLETENLVIMVAGNADNYEDLLHAVSTFGYPILWGILAMGLMLAGLKKKDIRLRKIALFFFGFIICKFYLYDVWRMSQGGRIVSFVVLGLILLTVSFMQERIKKLMKEE
ncbi:MAG: DUF2339 domain-containing protein [Tannerellaceae bacterium]|nr:DUF2339 domain-containing protein [Tannerellaceae bacterium]